MMVLLPENCAAPDVWIEMDLVFLIWEGINEVFEFLFIYC